LLRNDNHKIQIRSFMYFIRLAVFLFCTTFFLSKCFSMSLEKINALTVKDVYVQICYEIDVKTPSATEPTIMEGHCEVMRPIPEGTPWYQTLISVGKPAKASIENYFTSTYIPRLIQEETDRLAEVARVEDLKARWAALERKDGGFPSFRRVFPSESNPALWFANNLMNKDFIAQKMAEIEAQEVIVDAENVAASPARQAEKDELQAIKDLIDAIDTAQPLNSQKIKRILKRIVKSIN